MLYIGADHRGYQLKKYLIRYLKNELDIEAKDLGATKHDETDDAPDFAKAVAQKVAENEENIGILICWTGHAMCITANKIKGAHAILGYNIEGAEMGRQHNDANIICLASKFLSDDHAGAIVKKFLTTEFENSERLVRRNKKIEELEK